MTRTKKTALDGRVRETNRPEGRKIDASDQLRGNWLQASIRASLQPNRPDLALARPLSPPKEPSTPTLRCSSSTVPTTRIRTLPLLSVGHLD